MRRRVRWYWLASVVTVALSMSWIVFGALDRGNREAALQEFSRSLDEGRPASAREHLAMLEARWPSDSEVLFAAGRYASSVGKSTAAIESFAQIPASSPRAEEAALLSAQIMMRDLARFADAETILTRLSEGTGANAVEARRRLAELWQWQIRSRDIRQVLREGFAVLPDPPITLRDLWLIESEPIPTKGVSAKLDAASKKAPGDDRVWLGRANLAIETGDLSEARRLLVACLEKRPNDTAVWQSWLRLAMDSHRLNDAWLALEHLPSDHFDQVEILGLRAWLASETDDRETERLALEQRIALAPGDQQSLGRLAELAAMTGDAARSEQLRRKKAEADQSRLRYRARILRPNPEESAKELASLAKFLGRHFDASAWNRIALHKPPSPPNAAAKHVNRITLAHSLDDLHSKGQIRGDTITATRSKAGSADFIDDAESAGLKYVYDNGQSPRRQLPETSGGGVGVIDFDGDGRLDVYAVQGGPFPPVEGSSLEGDRLFRNRGDGTFEDVTESSGIAAMPRGYGHGVAVGDYDNDGHADLFVTRWRSYALYRNRGDGTFEDVTARVGLSGDRDWPTSAAFADLDNDGDLDLYVCHYLVWNAEAPRICAPMAGSLVPTYCHPHEFQALPDRLFRNDGGTFTDITEEAGIVDTDGRGLGVVAADLDGDHLLDLVVANDTSANFFFHNKGGMRFEEVGLASGIACNASGGFQAGMGVACGDLDGDGRPDIVVTNFFGESSTLFQNLGGGLFVDGTANVGLAARSRSLLGFGVAFLDYNNDGHLDLATANGHVNDFRPHVPYAMPALLMAGSGGNRLIDVSADAGPPWQIPRVGRGLALGDLDNDGRPDLLIVGQDSPLAYFHNRTKGGGHFLTLALEGNPSNRDGVGALVTVTAAGRRQVAQRFGGGSYLSASDPRLHFGVGAADRIERVEVRWPSGRVTEYHDLPANGAYRLLENEAAARPLAGFRQGGE